MRGSDWWFFGANKTTRGSVTWSSGDKTQKAFAERRDLFGNKDFQKAVLNERRALVLLHDLHHITSLHDKKEMNC